MLRPRAVHVVGEDQVRLAGLDPRGQDADPQRARRDRAHRRLVLRRQQRPLLVRLHRAHERVGHQDAVVQVQRLAVRIAAGGAADLDELLDLGMPHRQIAPRPSRAAASPGEIASVRLSITRMNGITPRGLADRADLLADRAQVAPVGADAAALRGQPDVLVPQPDDALQAVGRLVQEAGDRQAALRAAVRQHRRRRHEPQLRHVVVDALRVAGVVAVVARRRGRTGPGTPRPASGSGRTGSPGRNRSAARRASGRYGPGGDLASGLRRALRIPPDGLAAESPPLARVSSINMWDSAPGRATTYVVSVAAGHSVLHRQPAHPMRPEPKPRRSAATMRLHRMPRRHGKARSSPQCIHRL